MPIRYDTMSDGMIGVEEGLGIERNSNSEMLLWFYLDLWMITG